MWASNKSLMRENADTYIESSRLMVYLEEAAEQIQLEKCSQENVKLYRVNGDEFYFFIEVSNYKHKFVIVLNSLTASSSYFIRKT